MVPSSSYISKEDPPEAELLANFIFYRENLESNPSSAYSWEEVVIK